jgi:hypothetical protein
MESLLITLERVESKAHSIECISILNVFIVTTFVHQSDDGA